MNKRIEDIAAEAGFSKDKYNLYWDDDSNKEGVDLEKFAQLIVADCIYVMESTVNESIDFRRNLDETSFWIESDIKKYFGVSK